MKRSEKDAIIDEVAGKVEDAQALYFADFTGLTVADENELRGEFRSSGVDYTVYKNTLVQKALERVTGYDSVYDYLTGPTGIAFCAEDVSAPARIIKKFNEKTGKMKLKVAVLEKQVYDGSRIADLAAIPTRKELMASILRCVEAPSSGVVGVVNAFARDLVSVIDQISEKKKAA
jgi:large subunit ribosomal protein L10